MLRDTEKRLMIPTKMILSNRFVYAYHPENTEMPASVQFNATSFSFLNLEKPYLYVRIHAQSETGEILFVYIERPAFGFLTHLINGSTLCLVDGSGQEWFVPSVGTVLESLRDRLIADGIQPNQEGNSFEHILWHLTQPESYDYWWIDECELFVEDRDSMDEL